VATHYSAGSGLLEKNVQKVDIRYRFCYALCISILQEPSIV